MSRLVSSARSANQPGRAVQGNMYHLLPRKATLSRRFRRDQSGHAAMYMPVTMLINSLLSLVRPDSACSITAWYFAGSGISAVGWHTENVKITPLRQEAAINCLLHKVDSWLDAQNLRQCMCMLWALHNHHLSRVPDNYFQDHRKNLGRHLWYSAAHTIISPQLAILFA